MAAHRFTFLRTYHLEQHTMTTENQTLQQLLAERVTAFADSDRPREIIDKSSTAISRGLIEAGLSTSQTPT